jgi:tetratricopeptide (TPR) repeat protein
VSRNDPRRYEKVWVNLEARAPEQERPARHRRQTAEQLRAELLEGPPESWLARLVDERFCNQDLFEHLLEVCHEAMPFNPRRGYEVSEVALELGRLLSEQAQDAATVEALCRALCLGSHARRLIGEPGRAEALLVRAAFLAHDSAGRGFFCRAYGLLRWDQGRMEEAAALLLQAGRRYRQLGDEREAAICEALVGILYSEEGDLSQAESTLRGARSGLDTQSQPLLAAQVRLALARCLALTARKADARTVRESAWRLYPSMPMEEARCALRWLEAQVADAVGDLADAGTLFNSVRRTFLAKGHLAEATLATIQLSMVLIRQGRGEKTPALAAELTEAFGGRPGFDLTLTALRLLADETAHGTTDARTWSLMAPSYLLSFRLAGISPQPVPFV